MIVNQTNTLEQQFDIAKQHIQITIEGKINLSRVNELNGQEKVLLYLIGKLYAKAAELVTTEESNSKEILDEFNIPEGSFYTIVQRLRDKRRLIQSRKGKYTYYSVPINVIEQVLREINGKNMT